MGTTATGFSAVDSSADPGFFIDYLDHMAAALAEGKQQLLSALRLAPGQVVLDVGSGTGDDVRAMARLVGPSGQAIGVDASRVMVQEARRRAAGADVAPRFRLGDANDLPFPTASVDACRAERVLQHLADPAGAVAEMVRVTRPRGRVAVLEPDWETLVVDHPDHALTRRILDTMLARLPNPRVGRQLPRLLASAGLTGITVRPVTVLPIRAADAAAVPRTLEVLRLREAVEQAVAGGLVTGAQADRWLAEVGDAIGSGSLFTAMTTFVVAGLRSET
jgi:SAM-dependent methyltransferase